MTDNPSSNENLESLASAMNQLIDFSVQSEQRLSIAIERLAEAQLQYMQRTEERFEQHTQHTEERFEQILTGMSTMQTEVRDMQGQMLNLQSQVREIQSQMQGLQTENHRILNYLFNQQQDN